eukprot:CAMPEP_0182441532 /NCGR_PEP_ID=MMETSP1172-20130603/515_1 /TAXON_ID=708627 /ORGANISM="Timspurckia oligopyrenoides, Strain CCMP3278" /LENGTH=782 /DNA_ID=CAMNT_0024635881 /DNA_START=26 /DNA_END=2374 /DNA_ORIENTATION=+
MGDLTRRSGIRFGSLKLIVVSLLVALVFGGVQAILRGADLLRLDDGDFLVSGRDSDINRVFVMRISPNLNIERWRINLDSGLEPALESSLVTIDNFGAVLFLGSAAVPPQGVSDAAEPIIHVFNLETGEVTASRKFSEISPDDDIPTPPRLRAISDDTIGFFAFPFFLEVNLELTTVNVRQPNNAANLLVFGTEVSPLVYDFVVTPGGTLVVAAYGGVPNQLFSAIIEPGEELFYSFVSYIDRFASRGTTLTRIISSPPEDGAFYVLFNTETDKLDSFPEDNPPGSLHFAVTRVSEAGMLDWTQQISGGVNQIADAIAYDPADSTINVFGYAQSFTFNGFEFESADEDVFLAKLDTSSNFVDVSKVISFSGSDFPKAAVIMEDSTAAVAGQFGDGEEFPVQLITDMELSTEVPSSSGSPVPSLPPVDPTPVPSVDPTGTPSAEPTLPVDPTPVPSVDPTGTPSAEPTLPVDPTPVPSVDPTAVPSMEPTAAPSMEPTSVPTVVPSEIPTEEPSEPTEEPSELPSEFPTEEPTEEPTEFPTEFPTEIPTEEPTEFPTEFPTEQPTEFPTESPTEFPTEVPTEQPTEVPTEFPTEIPSEGPSETPCPTPPLTPRDESSPIPGFSRVFYGMRFAGPNIISICDYDISFNNIFTSAVSEQTFSDQRLIFPNEIVLPPLVRQEDGALIVRYVSYARALSIPFFNSSLTEYIDNGLMLDYLNENGQNLTTAEFAETPYLQDDTPQEEGRSITGGEISAITVGVVMAGGLAGFVANEASAGAAVATAAA